MLAHLRTQGVFTVKMGPQVVVRRWAAETVKAAIAAGGTHRLRDIPADEDDKDAAALADRLRATGWEQTPDAGGRLRRLPAALRLPGAARRPLRGRAAGRLQPAVAAQHQEGRQGRRRGRRQGGYDDLPAFHALYLETAQRDGFTPRALTTSSGCGRRCAPRIRTGIRLYLARREGVLLAATTWVRVGEHVWYSYGASSTDGREHRGQQRRAVADDARRASEAGARSTTCAGSPTRSTPTTTSSG